MDGCDETRESGTEREREREREGQRKRERERDRESVSEKERMIHYPVQVTISRNLLLSFTAAQGGSRGH